LERRRVSHRKMGKKLVLGESSETLVISGATASNNKKLVQLFPCLCHVLNLGVNRIFKVEFKKLWILVSTICKAARHSTIAQKLTNIHNDLKQKEKKIDSSCTCCKRNSLVDQIQRNQTSFFFFLIPILFWKYSIGMLKSGMLKKRLLSYVKNCYLNSLYSSCLQNFSNRLTSSPNHFKCKRNLLGHLFRYVFKIL